MVELEHQKVREAAVGALRTLEHTPDELHVSSLAPEKTTVGVERRWISPPRRITAGSTSPVAIHADDLTPGQFALDPSNRPASGQQLRETRPLGRDVIELQDAWIVLTTVGAAVDAQVLVDKYARQPPSTPAGLRRLPPVQLSSIAKVREEAFATPVLPAALRMSIESLDRLSSPTSSAALHLAGDLVLGRNPDLDRRRWDGSRQIAHPYAHGTQRHPEVDGDSTQRPTLSPQRPSSSLLCLLPSQYERMFSLAPDGFAVREGGDGSGWAEAVADRGLVES